MSARGRRRFLEVGGAAAMTGALGCRRPPVVAPDETEPPVPVVTFEHGVASGDPLTDRVVLWTRVTASEPVEVAWQVADDDTFGRIVRDGVVATDASRDHTVKVDVDGLSPGRSYAYRFSVGEQTSPVGRTRTLPAGAVDHVTLAVVSCSSFAWGFFNVYAAIAARDDVFAMVHLGDYIYEYANGEYGDGTAIGRLPDPPDRECITLEDYRRRHAVHKRDRASQAVHARHPCIAVWDDHELANDAWQGGAQNHGTPTDGDTARPDEGEWAVRRKAAVTAWREWMPVRDASGSPDEIHRAFRWGDLVELTMLDTRLVGRDRQVERAAALADTAGSDARGVLASPQRQLLGEAQERWLFDRLATSRRDGVAWRAIGQQVMMTQLRKADGLPPNLDAWDGYPAARDRLLDRLERDDVRDVVVLTGDVHSSWACEVARDPFAGTPARLVELVTPAVTSPPPSKFFDVAEILASHPHIRWIDMAHRGWLAVRFERTRLVATWHLTADVSREHTDLPAARTFVVQRGTAKLEPG